MAQWYMLKNYVKKKWDEMMKVKSTKITWQPGTCRTLQCFLYHHEVEKHKPHGKHPLEER